MEVNHFWHFLAQLSPPSRDGPLLAKGVQTRLWTNKTISRPLHSVPDLIIFDTFWHNYHHHWGMGLFWRKEYKQDCEQTNDFKAFAFCPWSYLSPHQSDILLLHQVYSFVSDVRRALSLLEEGISSFWEGGNNGCLHCVQDSTSRREESQFCKKTFITRSHGMISIGDQEFLDIVQDNS